MAKRGGSGDLTEEHYQKGVKREIWLITLFTDPRVYNSYEEEIARLRQQLEQAHARGGQPHPQQPQPPPAAAHPSQQPPLSSSLPPTTQSATREVHHPHHQPTPPPPPPNLGPAGSNYFGGIMNNPHDSPRTAQQQPGLATPPAHHNQQSYPGYPPSATPQQQQHPGYPNGSAPAMHHPSAATSSQGKQESSIVYINMY